MSDKKLTLTRINNYGSDNYVDIEPKTDSKPIFKFFFMAKTKLSQTSVPINTIYRSYGSI